MSCVRCRDTGFIMCTERGTIYTVSFRCICPAAERISKNITTWNSSHLRAYEPETKGWYYDPGPDKHWLDEKETKEETKGIDWGDPESPDTGP